MNAGASRAVAAALAGYTGRVVMHHHDLPWQRRHLAHNGADLPPRHEGALHATINLRSRRELEARGFAEGSTTTPGDFVIERAFVEQ